MMHHLVLVLLFFGAVSQTAFADAARALASIKEQTSWKTPSGTKEEVFDSKTLPSYRPHDSAIIIEYGFAKLTKAQLIHPEQKPLTIAIYEMLDSAAAYGLFTYLRPPTAETLTRNRQHRCRNCQGNQLSSEQVLRRSEFGSGRHCIAVSHASNFAC